MSKKYVTIEDLRTAIEVVEPSPEAWAAYSKAVETANKTVLEAITKSAGRRFGGVPLDDLDPPSYLPVHERPPERIPDLCPDDAKDEPHNPETCRDPACDCYPF